MKRVLIIAYYYPPLADVGSRRTVRFVSHMTKYGWEPTVLTVKNADPNFCLIGDELAPIDIKVSRVLSLFNLYLVVGKLNGGLHRIGKICPLIKPNLNLQDLLYIPDPIPGWLPMAYVRGKKLVRNQNFDLIYASVKPFGGALLALFLSKRFGIPFIVDVRDPLSIKTLKGRAPLSFKDRFICKYERKIVEHCKKFILTASTTEIAYKREYPEFRHKFNTVHNGFDKTKDLAVDFCLSEKLALRNEGNSWHYSNFIIIYLGNFYAGTLDPVPFFQAIKSLFDEDIKFRENILFAYLGENTKWLVDISSRFNLQKNIKYLGRKSRDQMMAYVRVSDLFFIRNPYPTNIGAKLFDGLAVNIPILSTYTHPEVEQLIKEYALEHSILYGEDVEEIKSALRFHFCNRKPSLRTFNTKFINDFSPEKLTKQLCSIFDDSISANSRST
ncbi:MAG: hypothetical protein ACOC4Y_02520 [bacterium]